jgi:hypothetical protein
VTPDWRIALASVIGTSHVGSGTPCQDSSACELIESADGGLLAAVVCDGAGSAAHSDIGSLLAATIFTELVRAFAAEGGRLEDITADLAASWVGQIAGAIEAAADNTSHPVRDYACTFLAAIIGPRSAAFIQIGDGAIVVSQGQDDGWSWVFWPQHGEFTNSTNFIVSPDVANLIEFNLTLGRIEEVAMFSDGLENLVLHHATRTVHAPFFEAMLPPVRRMQNTGLSKELSEELAKYLASPKVNEKTDDDKSLILATCRRDEALAEKAREPLP